MNSVTNPNRRAPNGVVTEKPLAIRLLPEERAVVAAMAKKENRSMGSLGRVALLRGLAELKSDARKLAALS